MIPVVVWALSWIYELGLREEWRLAWGVRDEIMLRLILRKPWIALCSVCVFEVRFSYVIILESYVKWDLNSAACKGCCYVNVVAVAAILRQCLRLKTFQIKAEVKLWARAVLLCPSSLSTVSFLIDFFQVIHRISVIENIWIFYTNLWLP